MKSLKALFLVITAVTIGACGSANAQIARVTAIPANEAAAAPSLTPSSTAVNSAQSTPTTLFDALVAQAPNATPTPLNNNLAAGSAAQIAAATDAAFQPTPRSRVEFEQFPVSLTFDEFYDGYNMRTGLVLSDKLLSLDGEQVTLEGYMAPPLKPELDYFVLTRIRLAFCPFCSTAGDWPDDIALVYLTDQTTTATERPVRITGRIEIGASVDQETGMVSLVRVYAEQLEILN